MKPRPRPVIIKSRINKHKSKDDVVKSMDMKLASGPDLIVARADMARARKVSSFLSYGTVYGSLIVVGILSIGIFRLTVKPHKNNPLTVVAPVATLDEDFAKGAISADQYANYLCCLLVRYDDLPQKYRGKLLKFDTQEVQGKLRTVWPRLTNSTRDEIVRFLPDLSGPSPGG